MMSAVASSLLFTFIWKSTAQVIRTLITLGSPDHPISKQSRWSMARMCYFAPARVGERGQMAEMARNTLGNMQG